LEMSEKDSMNRHFAIGLLMWFIAGVASAQVSGTPTEQPAIEKSIPITPNKPAKKSDEPPPCPAAFNDSLETNGVAPKVGAGTGIASPKATHTAVARMSDEARKACRRMKTNSCEFKNMISLVVDTNGNPTDLCVKSAAGYGLEAEAGKAIRQYRFEPATKDGIPVAARIAVESNFRIY
jgi:TonB family protein